MSTTRSLRDVSEALRTGVDRYVDLNLRWVLQDSRGNVKNDAEVILKAGARWDRQLKAWKSSPKTYRELSFHPGQTGAAKWLVNWFQCKAKNIELREDGRPIFSLLLHGGRRAGKTDLAAKAAITYAIMRPGANVWLVSENSAKTEELEHEVKKWLHSSWYYWRGSPNYQFTFPNGSYVELRSAHDPRLLKRGRCDFAVLNEAQNMAEGAFAVVRAATADNGGLTVLAANPPDKPIGRWIERFFDEARAGKRPAREFALDARLNPHVSWESLEAMKHEVDDRTYQREVLGKFLPDEHVVFHAWAPGGTDCNVRPIPEIGDVTKRFTRDRLGREFDVLLGIDFQRIPYPCAVEMKAFRDPDEGSEEPLLWYTDVTLVDQGDEEALSAALVAKGYDPQRTAIIADASGAFQGIDRVKKIPSFDILRKLGWPYLFKPDANTEKNPDIVERCRAANAVMRTAIGKRRVFSAPENLELNEALKLWENRNGVPYRKSKYAHLCDAATYLLWRFYPRRLKPRASPLGAKDMIPVTLGGKGPRLF